MSSRSSLKAIEGERFNKLTYIKPAGTIKNKTFWEMKCECGSAFRARAIDVKNGHTRSCGCLHREMLIKRNTKHGNSLRKRQTSTYISWKAMLHRCYNRKNPGYNNYGGRGIVVCERWKSFINFFSDMGERPTGMSLDRIDNNKIYMPGNCRWATAREQCENTRVACRVNILGDVYTNRQLAEIIGISQSGMLRRIKSNKSVGEILSPTK